MNERSCPQSYGSTAAAVAATTLRSRLQHWDILLCVSLNRLAERGAARAFFAIVSRLGNGVFWYALMLALLVILGTPSLPVVARIIGMGVVGVLLYKWLKARTLRPRPYQVRPTIRPGAAPLDEFSFPSGHTLHAVAFSTVVVSAYPALGWLVLPFTAAVALSRLVLGLHYPSDVLAGAAIGFTLAQVALAF